MDSTNETVFDAAEVLGLGTPSDDPLLAGEPGYITLRVPEGMSLRALRESRVGQVLILDNWWDEHYYCSREAPPAGTYRLRVPVPGSNRKTDAEQEAMLPEGQELAPVALVVVAMLAIHLRGGADPLSGGRTRCAERGEDGCRVDVGWCGIGRLSVFDDCSTNYRNDYVSATSVRID